MGFGFGPRFNICSVLIVCRLLSSRFILFQNMVLYLSIFFVYWCITARFFNNKMQCPTTIGHICVKQTLTDSKNYPDVGINFSKYFASE